MPAQLAHAPHIVRSKKQGVRCAIQSHWARCAIQRHCHPTGCAHPADDANNQVRYSGPPQPTDLTAATLLLGLSACTSCPWLTLPGTSKRELVESEVPRRNAAPAPH